MAEVNKNFYQFAKLKLASVQRGFRTNSEVLYEINGYYQALKSLGSTCRKTKKIKLMADNCLQYDGKERDMARHAFKQMEVSY